MTKSEGLKLIAENEKLRAELLKVTTKLDCALENNATLSAQMKDLQEKLDIIINQFNKQNKKQHSSKNEHHNPRQAALLQILAEKVETSCGRVSLCWFYGHAA